TMGDRVAVMRKGELQQVDDPQTLYDCPVNLFVAGFIGSPAMNLLEGKLEQEALVAHPALERYVGRDVIVGIRPEHLEDAALADGVPTDRRLRGRVALREALGSEIVAHITVDANAALTEDVRELAEDTDAITVGDLEADQTSTGTDVVARFNARSRAR